MMIDLKTEKQFLLQLLVEFDITNNTAKTENTIYELGKPSEKWRKWLEENNDPLS